MISLIVVIQIFKPLPSYCELGSQLWLIKPAILEEKSPSRKVGEIDNRGSHFYLALYWAEYLSKQEDNIALKDEFDEVYTKLLNNESQIINEIDAAQGSKVNLGGYYNTNDIITEQIMRPSKSFNEIIDNI